MRDYLELGPTPCNEPCAQVGEDDYTARAFAECRRYIECIRKMLGNEPDGARLGIKAFPHDFGNYHEVVCYYDDDNEEAVNYAFKCESDGPKTWCDK
jgi:hypothetical protein